MRTPDDNSHSAEHREPPTFMQRAGDEFMAIGREGTFTKAFSKLGMLALKSVPGGEAVIELTQVLTNRENSERQRRLQCYVLGVVQDELYNDTVELLEEDVIPVIRKLAADDEAAKTEYYIRLTVALGRIPVSTMSADLRYHFIRLVSMLTCFQIEFARKLKIRHTVPVCGTASLDEAALALTAQESGMVMQAVRTLQNAGLLKERAHDPTWKSAIPFYDTTSDFETLMELLFYPGDFEPDTVGLTRKELSDIIIVGAYCFVDNLYTTYLPEALRRKGLNVKIVEKNDRHLTTHWAPLYLHTVILSDNGREFIKLYLTREGTSPTTKKAENYLNCKFESSIYTRDKSRNQGEAEYFRKEMDRVASCIMMQLEEMKRSHRQ
ncbi:hypothetical protein C3369_00735 [Escherichia sp. ESNIH1]|uniref:hypothetical protein n=1 Tax=Escherichia sp. ESNIH1 TaxID=1985876 RepID=UPI000CDD6A04|nr:hypothetical protein [Escherichia sp. ESNIH1]POU03925.1 hypothetical protein C3369_00735 [Escherichia sp. ESNIH1]